MPTRDFKIGADGDLAIENGDVALVSDQDAVIQAIKIKIKMLLGECWLDESIGLPWIGNGLNRGILGKPAMSDPEIDMALHDVIAKVPDVTDVVSAGLVRGAGRTATINFSVRTIYSTKPATGQVTMP